MSIKKTIVDEIYLPLRKKLARIYRTILYCPLIQRVIYKIHDRKLIVDDIEMEIDFDVDAVYMWVDGDDPQIIQKRNKYLKLAGKQPVQEAIAKGRFFDNDELKYSLRSLDKYAPWIRHIYLITDNQVPKWLKENSKLTIVDHKDIIDDKYGVADIHRFILVGVPENPCQEIRDPI